MNAVVSEKGREGTAHCLQCGEGWQEEMPFSNIYDVTVSTSFSMLYRSSIQKLYTQALYILTPTSHPLLRIIYMSPFSPSPPRPTNPRQLISPPQPSPSTHIPQPPLYNLPINHIPPCLQESFLAPKTPVPKPHMLPRIHTQQLL